MISRRVLEDLTKRLKEIGFAKTKQKERHEVVEKEIRCYEI